MEFINLQLFADEAEQETNTEPENTDEPAKVTFTEEQQAYINSLLTERLAREKKSAAKKAEEKAAAAIEAEKLKNMSDSERTTKEMADLKKELEALKAEKLETEMMTAARNELTTRGYSFSDTIVGRLIGQDAESTKESIDSFVKEFEKAVKAKVKEAVPTTAPKTGTPKTLTKAEIMAVKDTVERQRLINENLNLFLK